MTSFDQTKPDFSGEWILNRQACILSPGADAIRSNLQAVEQLRGGGRDEDNTWILDRTPQKVPSSRDKSY